ncbi:hypothetical protein Tco_0399661 [Tanacetum coccineum]
MLEEISVGRPNPRVIVLRIGWTPLTAVAPPSDYIQGPEDPQTLQVPQDEAMCVEPMFIMQRTLTTCQSPIYPVYIPLEDDHEVSADGNKLYHLSDSPGDMLLRMTRDKVTSTQLLIDVVTTAFPQLHYHPLQPSYTIQPVDRRDDILESEQPPRKRLHLSTLGSRYEIGESSTARPTRGQGIDYGFV